VRNGLDNYFLPPPPPSMVPPPAETDALIGEREFVMDDRILEVDIDAADRGFD